ncbi:MAG: acetyl-CoA carboxylase carboxyltransferase subunit alpha [Victivallales bacterium]|jgi:acetyl-CoA carboxylase carboxyl transferase subunit alpha|nr:acetyl-CoA carboxylase carboxyltransferase subunit alpha [Victivallales bacterium]MBT7164828.1 acetyl-CoA carboxylase carboxyltransferase subunit alpha [Victivallales bacterium]MBT7301503.1 acetyl-CoA carboxylase carboxyltransferase subunit alpha [Victivallales bacterium]
MSTTVLDFEEPIVELERKVQELLEFSALRDVDVSQGVELLNERIEETRKRIFADLTPWQRVQLARHPERPHPIEYVERLCTDFLELKGDRRYADDRAIFGGFARLGERRIMLVGTRKGRNLKQNVDVNFGSAHPEGYRKALRLMQLASRAGCPIVCLIDTPGAYPGIAAEERHIGEAIAVNLLEMFRLDVPVVVVVTGEGGSGGALGIGVGNRVLIMENAYYSVITPEGCAAILWRDGAAAPKAAAALRLTSTDLLDLGVVDAVIPEPVSGAHRDLDGAAEALGQVIAAALDELATKSPEQLRAERYEKFRAMGVYGA